MAAMRSLDAIEADAKACFRGPWVAETWRVDCDCDASHDDHEVETVIAPEAYPADPDSPQVIAQIDATTDGSIQTPGLEQFATAHARFIAAARADVPALTARVRELERVVSWTAKCLASDTVEDSELKQVVDDCIAAELACYEAQHARIAELEALSRADRERMSRAYAALTGTEYGGAWNTESLVPAAERAVARIAELEAVVSAARDLSTQSSDHRFVELEDAIAALDARKEGGT